MCIHKYGTNEEALLRYTLSLAPGILRLSTTSCNHERNDCQWGCLGTASLRRSVFVKPWSSAVDGSTANTRSIDVEGCRAAVFEWAESYDTKDWERLSKAVASTLYVRTRHSLHLFLVLALTCAARLPIGDGNDVGVFACCAVCWPGVEPQVSRQSAHPDTAFHRRW